jgi:DNA gyrase subunit A
MVFVTDFGTIRKTDAAEFARINRRGKICMDLTDENGADIGRVVSVMLCSDNDQVLVATKKGMAIRIKVGDLRLVSSRKSVGVRAIRMDEGDKIISASMVYDPDVTSEERIAFLGGGEHDAGNGEPPFILSEATMAEMKSKEQFVLTVTENGFGKQTSAYAFRSTNRGGKGMSCMKLSDKTGGLISFMPVGDDDSILLMTNSGQSIRVPVSQISKQGRATRGVRIFDLKEDDKIVAVARIASEDNDEVKEEPDLDDGGLPAPEIHENQ